MSEHLTFDEMELAGLDPFPCYCWRAGYLGLGPATGLPHLEEWVEGAATRHEEDLDV